MAGRPWTDLELAELARYAPWGVAAAARALDRSLASVKVAAHRNGISLRPHETRQVVGKSGTGCAPSPRSFKPWTSKELDALRRVAPLGADAAAEILDRSIHSVRRAAERHGISLRRTGSRAGRLLGQPNGTRFAPAARTARRVDLLDQLRADLAAGRVALSDLDRALDALDADLPLCANCGQHPADHERSGFCTPCHRRRLAAAHAFALDARNAQDELWRERQAKTRANRKKEPHP